MHGTARSRTLGRLLLLALAMAAVAGAWYVRPFRHARLLGLDWRATVDSSAWCSTRWDETFCTTLHHQPKMPAHYAVLQINPWTRGVSRLTRSWSIADSARWSAVLDSIRRRMDEAGGLRSPCDPAVTGFRVAEAWRFGQYEVRLFGAPIPATEWREPSWYVGALLVPRGRVGCSHTRRGLLTPAQMARLWRRWLAEHIGF